MKNVDEGEQAITGRKTSALESLRASYGGVGDLFAILGAGFATVVLVTLLCLNFSNQSADLSEVDRQAYILHTLAVAQANALAPQSSPAPPKTTRGNTNSQLALIGQRLDKVEIEQKKIDDVILSTPEKALALPLMQRDLNDAKVIQAISSEALKLDIDRIYDIKKWLLGAMGLSVISFAINQLFRRKPAA